VKKNAASKILKKVFLFFKIVRGLCCVYRAEAGADDGSDPQYRNNAHLSKAVNNPCLSNFVGYYDATSLYPSSGKTKSFF